jgi:hypothetical protein
MITTVLMCVSCMLLVVCGCVWKMDETRNGTIEAYIRRFREQPPAPPEKRHVPNNVDFWWHDRSKSQPDSGENSQGSDGYLSPFSSRSSDSGRRSQRYSKHYDHDSDDDIGEDQDPLHHTHQSSNDDFDDFEKRTENLMKKCDNLLSDNQESKNHESIPPPKRNNNVMIGMESEEFPPWVSVDILPSPLKPPDEHSSALSPIKSSSPPLIEERNSPDSIESRNRLQSQEDDGEEDSHSSSESADDPSDVPDTESDVSDLEMEETSVETTDELIKRAEQLLNGYSAPEQPSQPLSIELIDSMTTTDPLLLPSPSVEIPIPETPPSRPTTSPVVTSAPETSPTQPHLPEKKIASCNEIGVQTDFLPINTSLPVNTSLMSSMTTTLFISPSSTPRHSPFPESDPLPDHFQGDLLQLIPSETANKSADGPLGNTQDDHDSPLPPSPQAEERPSPFPQPEMNISSSHPPLALSSTPNLSESLASLRYEDIEPYLSDEITASLWNRLVIVREQMKRIKRRQK